MRTPLDLDGFSRLTGVGAADVERYRAAGLLDPDGVGLFDDYDVLRLEFVLLRLDGGDTVDEVARGVAEGTVDIPFFGDLLYPRGQHLTVEEAAERLGFTVEQLLAISTAVGFPITRMMDEADLEALSGVKTMLDGGMPLDAVLQASRVIGDAFRRIAQTEVRLMHDYVHEPLAASGTAELDIVKQTHALMEVMQPILDAQLRFIHRAYVLRAVVEDVLLHMDSAGRPTRPGGMEATILFVDLSSFTPLAQVHGDEVAAAVLDRFDGLVRSLVLEHQGTLVKQIGDEFMLTFGHPADAVRLAVALEADAMREEHFPAMRVGIHAGPVLYRVGDYVGNTVNVAARIASAAMPGEVVLTEPVAAAAREAGVPVEEVGVRLLRGMSDPLPLFRLGARARRRMLDPVCGMSVAGDGAPRLIRAGTEYAFCSEECLRRFVQDPQRYEARPVSSPTP